MSLGSLLASATGMTFAKFVPVGPTVAIRFKLNTRGSLLFRSVYPGLESIYARDEL